jgi:exonuclease SbcD
LRVKFLQMADLHLAWPFTGLPERVSRLRRAELRAALVRIVDLALAEGVQLLLVAGDLYEHTHADRPLASFIAEQFERLGEIPVLVSPGNHDPFLPGSYWESFPWPSNVRVFGPTPERIDLDPLPVTVWGWGFGAWEVHEFQLGAVRPVPGRINLGLWHGGGPPYHPFEATDLDALGLDYVAVGHIHKPGPIEGRSARTLAWYSGSPEPLSFGEPGEHGIILGEIITGEGDSDEVVAAAATLAAGRARVDCRFVPLAVRACLTRDVDVTGVNGPEAVVERVRQAFTPGERERDLCRAILTGRIDPALSLDVALLTELLAADFFLIRLQDRTEPDWDLEGLARERTARGLFVQRLLRLLQGTTDEREQARVRRALHLGLTALAKGEGRT